MIAQTVIHLASPDGSLLPYRSVRLDVPITNIKQIIARETGIDPSKQRIFLNQYEIRNDKITLQQCGIKEGDTLSVRADTKSTVSTPSFSINNNATNNIASNPHDSLQQAISNGFLSPEELNSEQQQRMMEFIRWQNVEQNFADALEYHPESFGQVVMLYIKCHVNGVPMNAFVDTGAQMTIMSIKCAEKCDLLRLIDRRFQGIAKGVGVGRIVGKIHHTVMSIQDMELSCSITVIDNNDMEFILGLDMLKRFQASVDLEDNVLRIGNSKIPFLAEKDLFEEFPLNNFIKQTVPEEHINKLMNLGFSREEVLAALEISQGNLEEAASSLMGLAA